MTECHDLKTVTARIETLRYLSPKTNDGTFNLNYAEGYALDQLNENSKVARHTVHDALWDYVVVGAGVSGSACAKFLQDAGHKVAIVDKARGSGGRLSSKRLDLKGESYSYDLGVQMFTVHSDVFAAYLEGCGAAAFNGGGRGERQAYGAARNSLLARSNLEGVETFFGCRVLSVYQEDRTLEGVAAGVAATADQLWHLDVRKGEDSFVLSSKNIVLASPPIQSAEILGEQHPLSDDLLKVRHLPQWVAMAALPRRNDWAVFLAGFQENHPVLQGIHIDNAKSSRSIQSNYDVYVLHATTQWSAAHQDDDKQDVQRRLLEALAEVLNVSVEELLASAISSHIHRWLYSRVDRSACLSDAYLFGDDGLHFCGDYFSQTQVCDDLESAFLSAYRLCHECLITGGDS